MSGDSSWSPDSFARVEIEKMNGKGNLLTFSENVRQDHLHLSHGQVGQEVVIYQGNGVLPYEGGLQTPVLPFESIQEAARDFNSDTLLELRKGDNIKIVNPDEGETTTSVTGFNVKEIHIPEKFPEGFQATVEVDEIDGEAGYGHIKRVTEKPHKSGQGRTRRYGGTGNGQNPFKKDSGSKNGLLRSGLR